MNTAKNLFKTIETGFTFDATMAIKQPEGVTPKYKNEVVSSTVVGFVDVNDSSIKYKSNPFAQVGENFKAVVKTSNGKTLTLSIYDLAKALK